MVSSMRIEALKLAIQILVQSGKDNFTHMDVLKIAIDLEKYINKPITTV